ncbi:uncharacterized protein LOC118461622 [Anopheles albimanus]|uniref:ZAD domain-containing protein n=1 Tax=Anopheles albimanus TaxID=7167 RepID=A0A1Y9G8E9_ANOAL|nr:uncharacterized protein LOC118461622 [Anopheles albimanus]
MVGSELVMLSQGSISYEYRLVQSECSTESFVKSEVEIRSEIVDPTVRICHLCGSIRDQWENCFTSSGQLAIAQDRLLILRLLCSVIISFETNPDAVICEFCTHKLDEMVALRSIWSSNSTMIEQQRIRVPAINNGEPMVRIPVDAIKPEPTLCNATAEASQPACSPTVLPQNSRVAVQTDAPIIEQARSEANSITDSPVIEEPPSESCSHQNTNAAGDAAEICHESTNVTEPTSSAVQPEVPPVHAPEEPGNLQVDGQQVPVCSSNDGIPTDLTSINDIPTIDLTSCEESSGDDNLAIDEEKERLIRKAMRLVQSKFKVKRMEEPKRRRSMRLRNRTC